MYHMSMYHMSMERQEKKTGLRVYMHVWGQQRVPTSNGDKQAIRLTHRVHVVVHWAHKGEYPASSGDCHVKRDVPSCVDKWAMCIVQGETGMSH